MIDETMFVMFGYTNSEENNASNAVFAFNFKEKLWTSLFKNTGKNGFRNDVPRPRYESAIAVSESRKYDIFSFGGTDGSLRMNDLWSFNV